MMEQQRMAEMAMRIAIENGRSFTVNLDGSVTFHANIVPNFLEVNLLADSPVKEEVADTGEEQVDDVQEPVAEANPKRKYRRWHYRKHDPTFNALSDEEKRAKILSAETPTDICHEAMEYLVSIGVGRNSEGYNLVNSIPAFDKSLINATRVGLCGLNKIRRKENAERVVDVVRTALSV